MTDHEEWGTEYADAVAQFLEKADWIGALEMPISVQLKALARSLDREMRENGKVVPAAASQFAMTWARLEKRDPAAKASSGGDGLDPFLTPIPGLESGLAHGVGCACPSCGGAS